MAAERTVVVRIKAEYRAFQADMKAAARAAEQAAEATEKAGKKSSSALGQLMLDAKNNEKSWDTAGTTLLGFGAAVTATVGLAVAKYAEFEKAMSRVEAATHESAANMELLREAAIRAGADTAYSAAEAAAGIEELAKAGVSTADILDGGLNGALSLAAAGELEVGAAAEIAASAMTQFKLSGDQIPHLADLLAAGAGKAQGSVADLGAALNQSGLVAAQTGLTVEETTGALAAFASAGLTGSDAGTSFKTMLQALTPSSEKAATLMSDLGISAYDAQGNFIGMSEYAGVLQGALKDMSEEQRNATLKTIFGSDAVRAAAVLYEQGAEGIEKWEGAVNSAGFAALTASINQDNLLGDLEKLGGAFDTVFIKGGSGVSDALRGIVQGAEGLVDAIGQIPEPLLSTGFAIAGIVGVGALAAGSLMKIVPAAIETYSAFQSLGTQGGKIPGTLGKVAKAAGIAGIAFGALAIAAQILGHKEVKSTTDYAEAMMRVAEAGEKASSTDLDSLFQGWDTMAGQGPKIDSLAEGIERIANPQFGDGLNNWADDAFAWTGLAKSDVGQVEDRLADLGDEMGALVSSGNADAASATFRVLAQEFRENGKSAQAAMDSLPGYADALRQVVANAGGTASDVEILNWALDGTEPAALRAAAAAEETAVALDEAGVSAEGAVQELDKFMDALFALGEGTASVAAAKRNFKAAIDDISDSIEKNGKSLNTNTEAGRANEEALYGLGDAARAQAESMAAATDQNGQYVYTQGDIQKSLSGSYDSILKQVQAFGLQGEAAVDMTRAILGIPDGVSVDTWMSEQAKTTADATTQAVNGIPDMANVSVIVTDKGSVEVTQGRIQGIKDRTVSTTVTDEGTILEVKGGINNIKGKTEYVLVADDGTSQVVQARINKVTGKTEYIKVTDDSTVAGVQGKINSVKDGAATVKVSDGGTVNAVQQSIYRIKGGSVTMTVKRQLAPFHEGIGSILPKRAMGGPIKRATGGAVFGAGTATSDSIPALLSNGEHVLTAAEVMALGGHAAVERMRQLAKAGHMPAFASGGRVGWAENQTAAAARELKNARALSYRAARSKTEKDDKSAEKRLERAQEKYDKAREVMENLRSMQDTFTTDRKRGNITASFSTVDQLRDAAYSGGVNKTGRQALTRTATNMENQLIRLEKQTKALDKALDGATKRRDELLSVKNNVASSLSGEWGLSNVMDWSTLKDGPLTAGDVRSAAWQKKSQIQKFSKLLGELRAKGYSADVIADVASMGTNEGTMMAEALLAGSDADVKGINGSVAGINAYAEAAGTQVTNAMYKGGISAAEGVVRGLEAKQKDVESAFYKLGKQAEAAFKKALGIKSPSTVMAARADDTVDGLVNQLDARGTDVQRAMGALGNAPAYSLEVEQTKGSAKYQASMSGQGNRPQVVQHNEFHYPLADHMSKGVERANQLMTL